MTFSAKSPCTTQWPDFVAIFGYQDDANYYYMMFNGAQEFNQLFRLVDGNRTLIATSSQALITDSEYHTYSVAHSGSDISVLHDEAEVLSATDNTFSAGRVGVGTYNDPAWFDDIVVHDGTIGRRVIPPRKRSASAYGGEAVLYDIRGRRAVQINAGKPRTGLGIVPGVLLFRGAKGRAVRIVGLTYHAGGSSAVIDLEMLRKTHTSTNSVQHAKNVLR